MRKCSGMNTGSRRGSCLYKQKNFSPFESTVLEKFSVTTGLLASAQDRFTAWPLHPARQ